MGRRRLPRAPLRVCALTLVALAWALPVEASSVYVSTEDRVMNPVTGYEIGNRFNVTLSVAADSSLLPLLSSTISSHGTAAEAATEGTANFGFLEARARQAIEDSSSGMSETQASAIVSFTDEITITRPGASGTDTFRASFDLDGVATAVLSSFVDDPGTLDPSTSEASYTATITIGESVLEWTGSFTDDSVAGASTSRSSTFTVGAVVIPGALPVLLPGSFDSPPLEFVYGVPFELTVRIEVTADGDDNDTSMLSSDADFTSSFQWVGMLDLAADADVASASGADWRTMVGDGIPGCGLGAELLLLPPLLVSIRRRRRR